MNCKINLNINCDLGEGSPYDHLIMPYISACNIACGGHAGNPEIMKKTITLAVKNNVQIGAHPSFPDKENFGRKKMALAYKKLANTLSEQILLLKKIAENNNTSIKHVKLHGALYNLSAKSANISQLVVEVIKKIDSNFQVYTPYKSELSKVAKANNLDVVHEVFIDRNYNSDMTLVERSHQNAVIIDPIEVLDHTNLLINNKVKTKDGSIVFIDASTFCIHGDNPNVLDILSYLSKSKWGVQS